MSPEVSPVGTSTFDGFPKGLRFETHLSFDASHTCPLKTSLIIFVIAWIGQFIGHKIEGKKPSFFEDIQFLLIGPAWLLSFIYNKLGIKY